MLSHIKQKNQTMICKKIIRAVDIHRKAMESVYIYLIIFISVYIHIFM